MGYLARRRRWGLLAIKVIQREPHDAEAMERFRHEAATLRRHSPYVVPLVDAWMTESAVLAGAPRHLCSSPDVRRTRPSPSVFGAARPPYVRAFALSSAWAVEGVGPAGSAGSGRWKLG
ncbi:MAG: hypothetical protein HOV97_11945 [Nonomuraea sp.]|nr:hypothetical protein [Nonomuraea sp.]